MEMSEKYKNIFPDPLTRDLVPCTRIVALDKASGAEALIGCRIIRSFPANDYPVCVIDKGGFLLLDFGRELSGGVRIVTSGAMEPACRIRIRFGESCTEAMSEPVPDHAIHEVELTPPRYCTMDFGNTGFRFVRIDALDAAFKAHNILAVYEHRSYPQQGTFRSSDEMLNRIFDTSVHTIELNMQDYIYDGVKRDRLVWGGDMNPEAMAVLRIFGDVPVLRETLELLRSHTQQGHFINNYSSYSLWYFITLYDHWFHSGDDTLLKANRSLLEYEAPRFAAMVTPEGKEDLPFRRFLDWPSDRFPEIVHAGLQALLLMALRKMKAMLAHLSSSVTVPEEVLAKVAAHRPDPQDSKSAAALQTLASLADRRDVLEKDPFSGVSTYMGYYILLAKENRAALELVRKYWGGMLDLGATSFWEDFNLDWAVNATRIDELSVPERPDIHRDFGDYCYKGLRHSLCHGWAAGPAPWCSQKILGVEPGEPGFRTVCFHPDLCGLDFAEGTVPTPYGVISVSLKKGKAPEIELPQGIKRKEER